MKKTVLDINKNNIEKKNTKIVNKILNFISKKTFNDKKSKKYFDFIFKKTETIKQNNSKNNIKHSKSTI